jgi:hypothetical protein
MCVIDRDTCYRMTLLPFKEITAEPLIFVIRHRPYHIEQLALVSVIAAIYTHTLSLHTFVGQILSFNYKMRLF